MSEDDRKAAQSRVPMRRFGRPEEVAAAVRFLACAEASYITARAQSGWRNSLMEDVNALKERIKTMIVEN